MNLWRWLRRRKRWIGLRALGLRENNLSLVSREFVEDANFTRAQFEGLRKVMGQYGEQPVHWIDPETGEAFDSLHALLGQRLLDKALGEPIREGGKPIIPARPYLRPKGWRGWLLDKALGKGEGE